MTEIRAAKNTRRGLGQPALMHLGGRRNVGLMMRQTFGSFTHGLHLVTKTMGLTPSEFRVLRSLAVEGPIPLVLIASLMGMDRSDAGVVVGQLRKKQYVSRSPDRTDNGRQRIKLTASGRRAVATISMRLKLVNQKALEGVSQNEFAVLSDVLHRMQNNIETLEDMII